MCLDKFIIDPTKPTHLGWWAEYFEISSKRCSQRSMQRAYGHSTYSCICTITRHLSPAHLDRC
jgi:hypothetical protein